MVRGKKGNAEKVERIVTYHFKTSFLTGEKVINNRANYLDGRTVAKYLYFHAKLSFNKGNQPLNIKTAVERPILNLGLPKFWCSFYSILLLVASLLFRLIFMTSQMTHSSTSSTGQRWIFKIYKLFSFKKNLFLLLLIIFYPRFFMIKSKVFIPLMLSNNSSFLVVVS